MWTTPSPTASSRPEQYSRYDAVATRAQFASILAASLDRSALSAINSIASGAIPDVPASASYAGSVYLLYNAGVLTGRDAQGSFSPQAAIQRCEAAAIVARMAVPTLRQTFTLAPSSGRVLVAQPLEQDPLDHAVTADSVVIQDLVEFCAGGLTYGDHGPERRVQRAQLRGHRGGQGHCGRLCGRPLQRRLQSDAGRGVQ